MGQSSDTDGNDYRFSDLGKLHRLRRSVGRPCISIRCWVCRMAWYILFLFSNTAQILTVLTRHSRMDSCVRRRRDILCRTNQLLGQRCCSSGGFVYVILPCCCIVQILNLILKSNHLSNRLFIRILTPKSLLCVASILWIFGQSIFVHFYHHYIFGCYRWCRSYR